MYKNTNWSRLRTVVFDFHLHVHVHIQSDVKAGCHPVAIAQVVEH